METLKDQLEGRVLPGSLRQGAGENLHVLQRKQLHPLLHCPEAGEKDLQRAGAGAHREKDRTHGFPVDAEPGRGLLRRKRRLPHRGGHAAHRPALPEQGQMGWGTADFGRMGGLCSGIPGSPAPRGRTAVQFPLGSPGGYLGCQGHVRPDLRPDPIPEHGVRHHCR